MRFTLSCCCGARYEVTGWGIRSIDGAEDFAANHQACITAWRAGASKRPQPRDPGSRVTR